MHKPFFWNLLFSFLLHVQTINFNFFCRKRLHSLQFTCGKTKFCIEGFECWSCLTFVSGRLLALTKLSTEPKAAPPCVYNLSSFWGSYFERNPASPPLALAFWFRTRVGDTPATSCKIKLMYRTSAFLRRSCWASLRAKLQFSHHPITKSANLRAWSADKTKFCRPKKLLWQTVFCLLPP